MAEPFIACSPAGFPASSGVANPTYENGSIWPRADTTFHLTVANYTAYLETAAQPTRTAGGTGFNRPVNSSFASGNPLASWVNSSGIEVLRIAATSTGVFQLQYWNGSSWSSVSGSVTPVASTQYRWLVEFSGLGTSSGALSLTVVDNTEAVLGTASATGLNLTSATNVQKMRVYAGNVSTGNNRITECFIKDGGANTAYVYSKRPTSNGTDTDGTGTYTNVDDAATTSIDTDLISLAASGNRQSVRMPARSMSGRSPVAVGFETRLRCGASGVTQVKPYLKISGVRYYHSSSPVTLGTSFSNYTFAWTTNPATGSAWTTAAAEDANLEMGIEVV